MDRITRRRFVAGLAAAPALGLVGQARSRSSAPSLISHNAYYANSAKASSDFDLSIGALPANSTGRPANAVAIHGGVPGPRLRSRQCAPVTQRVAPRLVVDTRLHWPGHLLPSNIDGVQGQIFPAPRPDQTHPYPSTHN